MNAFPAEIPDICRSHKKDEEYRKILCLDLKGVLGKLVGPRAVFRWDRELTLAADFSYFGFTSLLGMDQDQQAYSRSPA